jgi:hypothetical protein
MMLAWIAICIVVTAAISLYLASPDQTVTTGEMPRVALNWIGWTALGLGIAALLGWGGCGPAVFALLAFAMVAWSVVPLIAAWLRHARETKG